MQRLSSLALALVLAVGGCTDEIPITVDSECAIGEWLRPVRHELPAEWKESRRAQCIPASAVTDEGEVHCRGFLRVPVDELGAGEDCASFGLDTWSALEGDGDTLVCELPLLDDDVTSADALGIVLSESEDCGWEPQSDLWYELDPLPSELPGQAEIRCETRSDPACPWQ